MEVILIVWGVCGVLAAVIASAKHRSAFGWFLIGVLFGPLGVLAALIVGDGDPIPKGMRKVVCPHCFARQAVDLSASQYECWQCKRSVATTPIGPRRPGERETWQEWLGKEPPRKN